jgi:hypothetical protein
MIGQILMARGIALGDVFATGCTSAIQFVTVDITPFVESALFGFRSGDPELTRSDEWKFRATRPWWFPQVTSERHASNKPMSMIQSLICLWSNFLFGDYPRVHLSELSLDNPRMSPENVALYSFQSFDGVSCTFNSMSELEAVIPLKLGVLADILSSTRVEGCLGEDTWQSLSSVWRNKVFLDVSGLNRFDSNLDEDYRELTTAHFVAVDWNRSFFRHQSAFLGNMSSANANRLSQLTSFRAIHTPSSIALWVD